jgi:hypothetical protein
VARYNQGLREAIAGFGLNTQLGGKKCSSSFVLPERASQEGPMDQNAATQFDFIGQFSASSSQLFAP